MPPFLTLLGVLSLLAMVSWLVGRMLAGVFGVPLLRRATPESMITSAFLGTGFLILAFGWCSYAGMNGALALLTLEVVGCLLGAALVMRRRVAWLSLPKSFDVWIPTLGIFAVASVLGLLTVLVGECYNPYSDIFAYVSAAECLQTQDMSAYCRQDSDQPLLSVLYWFQEGGFRIGAIFMLALVRSCCPNLSALELFPVVMTWGVLLNVGGIYMLCRWSLRLPRSYATFAAAIATATSNPLSFSATSGFLCQVYGTAALTFGIAILGRLVAPSNWRYGNAFLFSVAAITLMSAYSEASPILAIVSVAYLLRNLVRAWREGRLIRYRRFCFATILMLELMGNVEFLRATRAIMVSLHFDGVGWQMLWSPSQFLAFALGAKPYDRAPFHASLDDVTLGIIFAIAALCFVLGALQLGFRRRTFPIVMALAVFGALGAYYRFVAVDPWSSQIGHTWNQFKLCKWSFPLLVAVEAAGLYVILRKLPGQRVVLMALGLCCMALPMTLHLGPAVEIATHVQNVMGTNTPFATMQRLQQRVDDTGAKSLYFIHEPVVDDFPVRCFVAYMLYPRPFLNDWKAASFLNAPWLHWDHARRRNADTLHFVMGKLPFDKVREQLPTGLSIVESDKAFVFKVTNPHGADPGLDGEKLSWIGARHAYLHVWSPQSGVAVFNFDATLFPGLPADSQCRLRLTTDDRKSAEVPVKFYFNVSVPLKLVEGINRIKVDCLDHESLGLLYNGQKATWFVGMSKFKIAFPYGEAPPVKVVQLDPPGLAAPQ